MKTAAKWLLLAVLVLQATGAVRIAHLAECSVTARAALCRCGDSHDSGEDFFAGSEIQPDRQDAPSGGKPVPHRHDPYRCSICHFLLTLAATTEISPALPVINEGHCERPALADRDVADTLLVDFDARGPPPATT